MGPLPLSTSPGGQRRCLRQSLPLQQPLALGSHPLGAVHGCKHLSARHVREAAAGPCDWRRSPLPSANTPAPRAPAPELRPHRRVPAVPGAPWGPSGVTPTFLIRESRTPGAGGGARGGVGSPGRRQPRAQPQPQLPPGAVGGSSWLRPRRPLSGDPAFSPGRR